MKLFGKNVLLNDQSMVGKLLKNLAEIHSNHHHSLDSGFVQLLGHKILNREICI